MSIETILKQKGHDCANVRPDETVATAVGILARRRVGAVVVSPGPTGPVVGIFSERDLVTVLDRDGHAALDRKMSDVMTAPVITCKAEDRIDHVLAIMSEKRIRHMPVVNGTQLNGMISIRDLVRHRLSEKELEAAVLLDISRMHG